MRRIKIPTKKHSLYDIIQSINKLQSSKTNVSKWISFLPFMFQALKPTKRAFLPIGIPQKYILLFHYQELYWKLKKNSCQGPPLSKRILKYDPKHIYPLIKIKNPKRLPKDSIHSFL